VQETWKFRVEERVRWRDVDAVGIIFYGAYIRLFEVAETELFREIGLPFGTMFDRLNVWLPRVHVECDFKRAARLDDLLEIALFVEKIGNSSITLKFEVIHREDRGLFAIARFVLVTVRRSDFKTVPVPDELREKLSRFTAP
jgi:YbgC/YbaW family acyl-CoA thioester hydrolase